MSVPKLSSEALKKITDMMCPSAAAIKVWLFGWEKVKSYRSFFFNCSRTE